jgi:ribosome-associated translation inhibitor RaiA
MSDVDVIIHFKDFATNTEIKESLEARCQHLAQEFPETAHYELTLTLDADEISAHAHVSGKGTRLASHARSSDLKQAGEVALDKLERELRRDHDKRIFTPRRDAQRAKRKEG